MLAKINHRSIIKLKRVHESKSHIFIVMELVEAGTIEALVQYRKEINSPLTDFECSSIMRQILEALAHIHKRDIVHHDLKPQNILMKSFHKFKGAVKVADFGLGRQDMYLLNAKCGTLLYMAPEQFTNSVKSAYRKVRGADT